MHRPVEVTPLPDYRLHIRYDNGVEGDVDLSHLAGKGVFAYWTIAGNFERVSIGPSGSIQWTDAIDLCPDSLYMQITGKSPAEVFPSLAVLQSDA